MKRELKSFDFLLVLMVIALAIFGIIIIGSATHIVPNGPSDEYRSQQFWFVSGLALLIIVSFIDYHFICRFYVIGYAVNMILLLFLLLIGGGSGVSRWLSVGGFSLQPSEFSKLFMIIFLAQLIEIKQSQISKLPVFGMLVALVAVPVYLIFKQPALSASIVVFFISICIIYSAKISYKYIVVIVLVAIPIAVFTYFDIHKEKPFLIEKGIVDKYMIERVMAVLYPDDLESNTFQTERSISVIASGRMDGKGLYNGIVNQINYVPESHNDFIFSVIGEELGFFGSSICIGTILLVVFKCILIAGKAPDMSGKLIAVGVASMIAFQSFVNIGVAIGIVPNTGMPLPFISSGGSSMWVSMIGIGLCVNVGMFRIKKFFE